MERQAERYRASLVPFPEPVALPIIRAEHGAMMSIFIACVSLYHAFKLVSQGSQDGHGLWDDSDVGTAIVMSFLGLSLMLLGSLFPPLIRLRTKYCYVRACNLLFFAGTFCLYAIYGTSWNSFWRLKIYRFTILPMVVAYVENYLCARAQDCFKAIPDAAAVRPSTHSERPSTIEMGAQGGSEIPASVV